MKLKDFLKIENNNAPKTKEDFYKYCNEGGYNIEEQLLTNRRILQTKYEKYDDDIQFYKEVLQEYALKVIPLLMEDYKNILSQEIIERINDISNNIKIIKLQDSKSKSEAYCDQRKTIYFVPELIDKNPIEKALFMKSSLLHEIHHIITSNLIKTDNPKIQTDEDRISKSRSGYYIDEGVVEKSTLIFAKKHNLFVIPAYGYISNVKLIEFIMQKLKIENISELWNRPYNQILSQPCFEKEDLDMYNQFEEEYIIKYTLGNEKYNKWKTKQQLLEQRKYLETIIIKSEEPEKPPINKN